MNEFERCVASINPSALRASRYGTDPDPHSASREPLDYEFAVRCSRLGAVRPAAAYVRTSARAWRRHGLIRSTLRNSGVIAGYRLGVDMGILESWRAPIADRGSRLVRAPAEREHSA